MHSGKIMFREIYTIFLYVVVIKQMIHSRDKYFTYIYKSFIKSFFYYRLSLKLDSYLI